MPEKRLRVVIDTNIFISFLINRDFSKLDKIIIEGKAVLLLSEELLDEILTVLNRPKFKKYFSKKDIDILIDFLTEFGLFIKVKSKVKISRDHKDDFLLSLAIDGKATHLITGDADLLILKKVKKTTIITIQEFLAL
jgi:uncharacterized protein